MRVRSSRTARRWRSPATRANSTASAAVPAKDATTRTSSGGNGGAPDSPTTARTPTTVSCATRGTTTVGRVPSSTEGPAVSGASATRPCASSSGRPAAPASERSPSQLYPRPSQLDAGHVVRAVHGPDDEAVDVRKQQEGGLSARQLGGLRHDEAGGDRRVAAGQQPGRDIRRCRQPRLPPPHLLEQARVLDGHPGGRGERHDEVLVALGELAPAALLGEVEVAEDLPAGPDGHPRKVFIGGWFGGNPHPAAVLGEVGDPQRPRIADRERRGCRGRWAGRRCGGAARRRRRR